MNQIVENIEKEHIKTDLPDFKVGDTISVHYRIIEGQKERIQVFTGTVIAIKGKGISMTVSLYRTAYGSAMERVIPLHSPKVAKIEVVKRGKVRKGKLYYLRGVFGKKAKIQERIVKGDKKGADPEPVAEAPAAPSLEAAPDAPTEEESKSEE